MTKSKQTLIACAALAGLYSGALTLKAGAAVNNAGTSLVKADDKDKSSCKGKNDCKGKGGCKSSKDGCKGKNECKGRGGCGSKSSS